MRLEPFAVPARVDLVKALPRNPRGKLERRVNSRVSSDGSGA
jgi:acyl-coenzyme A synthetase/AMP-(fatty) acid ligase